MVPEIAGSVCASFAEFHAGIARETGAAFQEKLDSMRRLERPGPAAPERSTFNAERSTLKGLPFLPSICERGHTYVGRFGRFRPLVESRDMTPSAFTPVVHA